MKFDALYPDASPGDEMVFEGSGVLKCLGTGSPCWHCRELTTWVDINFEAYLCSEECERAKWSEYWEVAIS
jgi:hypothetical protein